MPNAEAYKHFSTGIDSGETLRDAVLRVTNDGDFRSCDVADAFLEITISIPRAGRIYRSTRAFPLEMFPSVGDMVRNDWTGPEPGDYY